MYGMDGIVCFKRNGHGKLCKCNISLSNMSEKILPTYAAGKKH